MAGNRLLPLLALAVLAILVLVGVRSCDGPGDTTAMKEVPQAAVPDADTPADTIRTLTARLGEVKSALDAMRTENQGLRDKQADLERDVRASKEGDRSGDRMSALTSRIEELSAQVHGLGQSKPGESGEVPVGFGLDGEGKEEVMWIRPLDQPDDKKTGFVPASATAGQSGGGLLGGGKSGFPSNHLEKEPLQPYYTVPRNATLIGGTGLTALIGRVPIKGTVRDPVPFKVIVGKENLAANGYDIPNVEGMIFSGFAVGDWTLACVHGRVNSVTYVFQDGTIRTISADQNNANNANDAPSGNTAGQVPMTGNTATDMQNSLGWVSDDLGIPCVSGQRITNAPTYLASRVGLTAAEAAAAAAAASQTTTILTGLGGTNSAVTGDKGKFVWASALQGGVKETDEWLKERMENSYDAIFAPPGMKLAVHLDRELKIDYDPQGRRLSHVTGQNDPFRQPDLD